MTKESRATGARMIAAVRKHLRGHGWTIASMATELGVGPSTIKRWLAGRGLTLDKLEVLAELGGLQLSDLLRDYEAETSSLAKELTLAQEKALAANIFLSFLFYSVLRGVPIEETIADFAVPHEVIHAALQRLERLALVRRLRSGRIRSLVDPAANFKSPLRELFVKYVKPQFMDVDLVDRQTSYASELVKLSPEGGARLSELIVRHRREVLDLAEEDRKRRHAKRIWYGTFCIVREVDMTPIHNAIEFPEISRTKARKVSI